MLRNREGFTLIELLIVVVIIGILAAIALPKFGQTRERAYVSAMQSDLRNLQSAQEMYYADNNYLYAQTASLTTAATATMSDFSTTSGVAIAVGASPTGDAADGYVATATHAATDQECTLTVGGAGAQGIICN